MLTGGTTLTDGQLDWTRMPTYSVLVARAANLRELVDAVNEAMLNGFRPLAGIAVTEDHLYQAIIRVTA